MSAAGWQDVAAAALALAALIWLVRRRLRRRARSTPCCDECPACRASGPADGERLIPPSELMRGDR